MKTKYNDDLPVKIFLVVVGIILAGFIVAWSMGLFKEKKNDLNDSTERINSAISSMSEFDLLIYDGATISGESLIELIDEVTVQKDTGIEIKVNLLDKSSLSFKKGTTTSTEKINPNGVFEGDVHRDDNQKVDYITFTQKKK